MNFKEYYKEKHPGLEADWYNLDEDTDKVVTRVFDALSEYLELKEKQNE